jgi:hypothetical protein
MAEALAIGESLVPRARERSRRQAARVILVLYVTLIFDGAVRKYLLPEYRDLLVFVRDPVAIYLYILAFAAGFIRPRVALWVVLGIVAAGLLVVVLQWFEGSQNLIFSLYGVRQYFSLCLLPFIMAEVMTHEDMQSFFKLNLFILVMMGPLMALQVLSPYNSWINVGGGGIQYEFENLTYGSFVRAPGVFTSGLPLVIYLPVMGAIIICIVMMPRAARPSRKILFSAALVAFATAVAVCGNRGAIVGLIIVALAGVGVRTLMPISSRGANRAVFWIVVAFLFNGLFATIVFPEQAAAFMERWADESLGEGPLAIFQRAVLTFGDFVEVIPDAPPLGFGIGTATNAFVILNEGSNTDWYRVKDLIESDWARHVAEMGPVFGIALIAFRVFVVVALSMLAIRYITKHAEPRPFMLLAASAPTILYGSMSGNTTMSGFGWFFAGLVLAAPNYARRFS